MNKLRHAVFSHLIDHIPKPTKPTQTVVSVTSAINWLKRVLRYGAVSMSYTAATEWSRHSTQYEATNLRILLQQVQLSPNLHTNEQIINNNKSSATA